MAALEPKTLQYMQFHTARLNISESELEDLRLKLSQNSPMQVSNTFFKNPAFFIVFIGSS